MTVRARASLILVFACVFWGFSFPIMKALEQVGRLAVPTGSSMFFAFLCVATRFTLAAVILAGFSGRRLRGLNRLELAQGGGLGMFGGFGLVLQMDGMAYTLASTSAFLTQGYCVLIPLWIALRQRRMPDLHIIGACLIAVVGAGILSGLGRHGLRLGRGEWETLLGSVLFAGQILWLERPIFHGNDSNRATAVMFAAMALTTWPLAFGTAPRVADVFLAYRSPAAMGLLVALTILCTLITFPLSNHWQPKIAATEAALLYCTEPVFASGLALIVPGFISDLTGIAYPNETLTWNLVAGGALILTANVWLQLRGSISPATTDQ